MKRMKTSRPCLTCAHDQSMHDPEGCVWGGCACTLFVKRPEDYGMVREVPKRRRKAK